MRMRWVFVWVVREGGLPALCGGDSDSLELYWLTVGGRLISDHCDADSGPSLCPPPTTFTPKSKKTWQEHPIKGDPTRPQLVKT